MAKKSSRHRSGSPPRASASSGAPSNWPITRAAPATDRNLAATAATPPRTTHANTPPIDRGAVATDDRGVPDSIGRSGPLQGAAPTWDRERARARMATALFGLLALVFLGAMVGVIVGTISVHDLKELSSFVTPLVVLVSTVTAFYFGGRVAK